MRKLFLFILFISIITACNNEDAFFDPKETFEIINIEKSNDGKPLLDNIDICSKWDLTEDEMEMVLKDSEVINKSEWHYQFSFFKCQYTGQIKQADKMYDFSVNAGSWFSVSNKDSTTLYGSFNKKHETLFIDRVWEKEN